MYPFLDSSDVIDNSVMWLLGRRSYHRVSDVSSLYEVAKSASLMSAANISHC
jgi:hypothetical protein